MNYVSIEHNNGDNAYNAMGHDFPDFEEAEAYLQRQGGGTIYVFNDEALEIEPDNVYQPTQWDYPCGLYVVDVNEDEELG